MMSNLSNAEIRNRLNACGYHSPPVTDSTRSVLIKKLERLEKSGSNVPDLANFSSADDETDTGSINVGRSNRKKRAPRSLVSTDVLGESTSSMSDRQIRQNLKSFGFDSPPVTDSTRPFLLNKLQALDIAKSKPELAEVSSADESVTSKVKNRRKPKSKPELTEFSSADESDSGPLKDKIKPFRSSTVVRPILNDPRDKEPKIIGRSLYSNNLNINRNTCTYSEDRYDRSESALFPNLASVERRWEQNNSKPQRPLSYLPNSFPPEPNSNFENATKHSGELEGFAHSTPITNEYRSHGSGSTVARKKSFLYRVVNFMDASSWILSFICLFFLTVLCAYYYNGQYGHLKTGLTNLSHLRCNGGGRRGIDCLEHIGIHSTEFVLEPVYAALQDKAISAYCEDKQESAIMTNEEIYKFMIHHGRFFDLEADQALYGVKLVARLYQNLTLSVEDGGIQFTNPILPYSCVMKKSFYNMMYSIIRFFAVLSMVLMGVLAYKLFKRSRESQKQELQQLVQNIRELLQKNALSNPGNNYLPINVIQRQLIKAEDRKKKQKMWDAAVNIIESDESRVRRDVQLYNNEEYYVWHWLPLEQASPPRRKTWQGEAFVTTKGAINSPSISPTQCLKIRHMFDSTFENRTNDLVNVLHNAILERCEGVKMVHIAVDETNNEGCVYVKCASTEDAGNAYRKMHGAWFDGKIVSVKYLRLERYHERFPDSVFLNTPLHPTNNLKSSLQH